LKLLLSQILEVHISLVSNLFLACYHISVLVKSFLTPCNTPSLKVIWPLFLGFYDQNSNCWLWFLIIFLAITLNFKRNMQVHFQYPHFSASMKNSKLNKVYSLHICPKGLGQSKTFNS
jgi:hypothetical protein